MKLTTPVNNFDSCIAQIDEGSDEIYVGYRVDCFKRISFSARPQLKNGQYLLADKAELSRIVQYASSHGKKVFLAANTPYFSDYPINGLDIEQEFVDYVQGGIDSGVDAVIVTDVGLLYTLHKRGIHIPLICSTLADVDNIFHIRFLKSLGVTRIVLSYQITLPEITHLCKHSGIEIEVFGYGGCSFGSNCILGHSERFGIPCENWYTTSQNSIIYSQKICSALNCALCSIWDLQQAGVAAIKLQGRERDYRKVIPLTRIFRTAINLTEICNSKEEYHNAITAIIPIWWEKVFCEHKQCKFERNYSKISISNIH